MVMLTRAEVLAVREFGPADESVLATLDRVLE
jgi:hypothetical protein